MTTERQFIGNHHPMQTAPNPIEAHLEHRNAVVDIGANGNIETNRRVIISEQNRQYVQFVQKPPLLANEAQVIVSNKVNCLKYYNFG